MGEQTIMNAAEKPSAVQDDHKDASEKLRLSLTTSQLVGDPTGGIKTNSQQTLEAMAQYKAGRYALVTAEGLSLLPSGIVNGVQHNWDHPETQRFAPIPRVQSAAAIAKISALLV